MRLLILLLLLAGCAKPNVLPTGDFYGTLKIGDSNFRLYLHNPQHPELTIVNFRGYKIPIDVVSTDHRALHFRRSDENTQFKGEYDSQTGTIIGNWIVDDSIRHPLIFAPVLHDTIPGLHPRINKEYTYTIPVFADNIPVCDLKAQNMQIEPLNNLMQNILEEKYKYIHSMLVARNGCLLMEEYFYGFRPEMHFGIQSATKSFVSALTGIALNKGEIKRLDTKLCQYLPRYQDLTCNEQNKSISLHNLLTMSTGLEWDEVTYEYGHEKNTSMIAAQQPDQFRYLLTRPRSNKKVFAYNSLNHLIMNYVLRESTKMENTAEMEERLIRPLEITNYDLGQPENDVIGDIFLRPRDMLKFGLMYQQQGVWRGKQIVPKSWIKESTTKKIDLQSGLGYGYFWWTKQFQWKEKTIDSYFAWGYGGQYIFVVPALELVVVFNGTNWSTDPTKYYLEIMEKYIVTSCEPAQ
ncbi:MAG: serine hydrolase domain-containing protein [Bacteroidota bacterium]